MPGLSQAFKILSISNNRMEAGNRQQLYLLPRKDVCDSGQAVDWQTKTDSGLLGGKFKQG